MEKAVGAAASLSFPLCPITIHALLIGCIIIPLKTSWVMKGTQGVKVIEQGCFWWFRVYFCADEVLSWTWKQTLDFPAFTNISAVFASPAPKAWRSQPGRENTFAAALA